MNNNRRLIKCVHLRTQYVYDILYMAYHILELKFGSSQTNLVSSSPHWYSHLVVPTKVAKDRGQTLASLVGVTR